MKTFSQILRSIRGNQQPTYQQLELPLRGSRVTRDDAHILVELQRLRQELAKA